MSLIELDALKLATAPIRRFAERPENWYRPGLGAVVPGDKPEHCLQDPVGGFRAVFSWTVAPNGDVLRHLSISGSRPGKLPNPVVVWTIAACFGFEAKTDRYGLVLEHSPSWRMAMDDAEQCLVIQELAEPGAKS